MSRQRTIESARPFLKWAGGKRQLLPELREHYPSAIGDYYEPFIGSGAVFFDLVATGRIRGRAHLWDSNPSLINVYRTIRDDPDELIAMLGDLAARHTPDDRSFYYARRDRYNDLLGRETTERAGLFIYLNRTCFNGLYRVNQKGEFNVPAGSYKNPRILDEENLRAVSAVLQDVELKACDFRDLEDRLPGLDETTFLYFDPPYQPLDETSNFTSYTKRPFTGQDQRELADLYRRCIEQGARALLSNSWTPLIRKLYDAFELREVDARRSINSKGKRRGAIPEALVLYQ